MSTGQRDRCLLTCFQNCWIVDILENLLALPSLGVGRQMAVYISRQAASLSLSTMTFPAILVGCSSRKRPISSHISEGGLISASRLPVNRTSIGAANFFIRLVLLNILPLASLMGIEITPGAELSLAKSITRMASTQSCASLAVKVLTVRSCSHCCKTSTRTGKRSTNGAKSLFALVNKTSAGTFPKKSASNLLSASSILLINPSSAPRSPIPVIRPVSTPTCGW